jgi:GMP synthase (glutamine-hydrolysing)
VKPVLIVQHQSGDGPAYLGCWLAARGLPFDLVNAEAGQSCPATLAGYGAVAILGGEMSANDELPYLRHAERLVRQAVALDLPTLGHCLGGQLMARALGARVVESPAPEIGWQPLFVTGDAAALDWFGPAAGQVVFQWHFDAFELPAGARRLASSPACPNQAFALGPHLAMQFHVELDAEKLNRWLSEPGERYRLARRHSSVQGPAEMRRGAARYLAVQQALADHIYARWIGSVNSR